MSSSEKNENREKTEEEKTAKGKRRVFDETGMRLVREMKPLRGWILLSALFGLLLIGCAVAIPELLGALIDRNPKVRHAAVVNALLAAQTALLVLLRIHARHDLLNAACYVLYIAAMMPVNAVNLDLCVRLERAKAPLNFGFARSMGSFSFMILSTILGVLIARWGFLTLPFAGLGVVALQFVGNRLIDRDLREAEALAPAAETAIQEKSSSLVSFVKENRMFCLMLFGTIILFIPHNMDGNFLINEIRNLGGDTATMGLVASFTAITEIPVMMFSAKLPKKWETVQYIRLSLVFFTVKILAYALAPNIPLFFAARVLQAPSYALYTVLIVRYADSVVARKDSAKAQSLAFSMTTIGSVLASLIGGAMFDTAGVRATMLTAVAISAVGTVVALLGTVSRSRAKQ